MKTSRHNHLLLLPLIFVCGASAQSVDVNFSSLGTSEISFDGSTSQLSFAPDSTTGFDFQVASSTIPGLVGYLGDIDGTFTIGTVHTISIGPLQVEEAEVSGTGTLVISDGTPARFSAAIDWNSVMMFGTGGILDAVGAPNLSDFTYHGSNPSLLLLSQQTIGFASASFQFVPPESLTELAGGDSNNSTTYSGSFEAIPEPRYTAAILGGFMFLGILAARLKTERWLPIRVK
jgi:hypothetical protein